MSALAPGLYFSFVWTDWECPMTDLSEKDAENCLSSLIIYPFINIFKLNEIILPNYKITEKEKWACLLLAYQEMDRTFETPFHISGS